MSSVILQKRIPTLFGILLVLGSVLITTAVVKGGFGNILRAAPQTSPTYVTLTNITDTSFTVTYATQDSIPGSISYSEDTSFNNVEFDDRDKADKAPHPHTMHTITIRQLKPKTTYHFKILSGADTFLDSGQPYTVITATTADANKNLSAVNGSVSSFDSSSEAIVYVQTADSQTLSSLVSSDGSYTVPLSHLLTKDLTSLATLDQSTNITVTVKNNATSGKAVTTLANANAIPPITLSENFDFSQASDLGNSESSPSAEAFPTRTAARTQGSSPVITSPKKDTALNDAQPEFTGTGQPNEVVDIVIHSTPITTTVKTDKNGDWIYRPTTPLPPGKHTITITTKNALGVLQTIEQSFVVNAQGSQFTEPSGTPQTTATPTPTPTTQPTINPTALPTLTNTPTPTIGLSPSPTFFPTVTPTPAPLENLKSGNDVTTRGIFAALAAIITGGIIFFLTRRKLTL